jgi:hypothetical protein
MDLHKFGSYLIGVAVAMAVALGIAWLKGGNPLLRTFGIFFAGWIVGATSMYIKAMLVFKP